MGKKTRESQRTKKIQESALSRRKFLLASGAGLAGILAGGAYFTQEEITFEDAKADESLRNQYFERHQALFARPYVKEVTYSKVASSSHQYAEVLGVLRGDAGSKKAYNIAVYDSAFSYGESELLSTVIDHEIDGHASFLHWGYADVNGIDIRPSMFLTKDGQYNLAWDPALELIAYSVQLARGKERGISENFFRFLMKNYCGYYARMCQYDPMENQVDPLGIDRAKDAFFNPFLLTIKIGQLPFIVRDGERYGCLLPDKQVPTAVPLPYSVCKRIRELQNR